MCCVLRVCVLRPVHIGNRIGRICIHLLRWMPIRQEHRRNNPWRTTTQSALYPYCEQGLIPPTDTVVVVPGQCETERTVFATQGREGGRQRLVGVRKDKGERHVLGQRLTGVLPVWCKHVLSFILLSSTRKGFLGL